VKRFLKAVLLIIAMSVGFMLHASERKFDFNTLSDVLVDAKGNKTTLDLKDKKYILVYYSSSWCSACRELTPKLVEFYNKNSGGLFEIIFMSLDFSEQKQLKYMREDNMPWPAVKFSNLKPSGLFEYVGSVMPWIAVFKKDGTALEDSGLSLLNSTSDQLLAKLKAIMTNDAKCESCQVSDVK